MNEFDSLIKKTEDRWLEILYSHINELYSNNPLPSHNEEHALRVWKYSVQLTGHLWDKGFRIDPADVENLIITIFFHDTGLFFTRGIEHGKAGSLLCKNWLESQSLVNKVDSEKILHAILNHDNKSYINNIPLVKDGEINLLSILSISDDLDAYGYIGIYRYIEIYLLRGTQMEELGQQVLSNASLRFKNFLEQCEKFPALVKLHTKRYLIIEKFFKQYNSRILIDPKGEKYSFGPYSIARFIHNQLLNKNYSVIKLCDEGIKESKNSYNRTFFIKLRDEWGLIRP